MRLLLLLFITTNIVFSGVRFLPLGNEPHDHLKRNPKYTLFGETVTGEREPEINVSSCVYSVDPYDWETRVSGTGSLSQTQSMCKLSTGASASSSAVIETKKHMVFHAGHVTEGTWNAIYPTCTAGNNTCMGLGDTEGFIGICCIGTSLVIRHDDGFGNVNDIAQADWDLDPALSSDNKHGFILDHTKFNMYRATYAAAVAPVTVEIYMGAGRGWYGIHQFDFNNTRTTPNFLNPSMPMLAWTSNTTNTTAIDLYIESVSGSNIGPLGEVGERFFAGVFGESISATSESHVASGRVSSTYQGRHNHIPLVLKEIDVSTDGNKNATFRLYRNCSITGSWIKVNSYSSVTEITTVGSSATCGIQNLISGTTVGAGLSGRLLIPDNGFELEPTESLTITVQSAAASAEISAVVNWVELH